jgi:hypothetical protein
MIVINMPGGAIQSVDKDDLLWLRNAFDSEWKGAVMLRLGSDRIYSIESVSELKKKFSAVGVALAEFTPPDARLKLVVSAKKVRQVNESDPKIYHEKANAVLVFSAKIKLAVRETLDDARERIAQAISDKTATT